MLVDGATLTELAILDPGDERASLFSLLDRARTHLGTVALKARVKAPPPPAQVRATQDAVRFLSTRLAAVHAAFTVMDPDAVDAYLGLRWQALTRRSTLGRVLEYWTLRTRYGDAVRQIRSGVNSLATFLDVLPPLLDSLDGGSPELQRPVDGIRERLDRDPLPDIRRLGKSTFVFDVLQADRIARGRARSALHEILGLLSEIDALTALAAATVEHGWCFPEFIDADGCVSFTTLRHPLLPAGVPNELHIEGSRLLALTGPNMAGKSTLLKAAGTTVYLAHLGCGVPATSARLSIFDALLASLSIRDSLTSGRSFYLGEVHRIRDLLNLLETTPRVFALLDEPFKGTNVLDAAEATALLIDGLCAQDSSIVIMATHLASVVESRVHDRSLKTSYVGAEERASGLEFTYVLRDGISAQRLGMMLLNREGVGQALASAIARRSRISDRGA